MAVFREEYKLSGKLVVIRNAEPDDAPVLIDLVNRFDSETTFLSREPGEFNITQERERALLQSFKDSSTQRFAVAEIGGRIVGTSQAAVSTRSRTRHTADIGIAVLAAHWGMGIGRALMETNIAWLREMGVEKVNLTVDAQNLRAIALYLRLGFAVEGRSVRDRKLADGTYRDSYWMSLDLTQNSNGGNQLL